MTVLDISIDVPAGVYADNPKAFLKRVEAVDLAIETGYSVQGQYIHPHNVGVKRNDSPGKDKYCFTYIFQPQDKEIYTFGVVLLRTNSALGDYGVKIALIFVTNVSANPSRFAMSMPMPNAEVGIEAKNCALDACQGIYHDSVGGKNCLSFPMGNMIILTAQYAKAFLESRGLAGESAYRAVGRNPYYAVAAAAHGYAFSYASGGGYAGAKLADNTGKGASGGLVQVSGPYATLPQAYSTAWDDGPKPDTREEAEELEKSKNSGGEMVIKLVKRLAKRIGLRVPGKDNKGNDKIVKRNVGSLPNGWLWAGGDVGGIQMIARGGNLALLNSLAKEGKLSEEVVQYMIDQADTLEELAHTYRLVAYSKLPEAQLESMIKRFGDKKNTEPLVDKN